MISERQSLLGSVATGTGFAAAPNLVAAIEPKTVLASPAPLLPRRAITLRCIRNCLDKGDETRIRRSKPGQKSSANFIAAHSTPVALRATYCTSRVVQPALHYKPEQVSKLDILQKSKTFRRQGYPRNSVALGVIYYRNFTVLLGFFVAFEVPGGFAL